MPFSDSNLQTQHKKKSVKYDVLSFACEEKNVQGFMKAVLKRILPSNFISGTSKSVFYGNIASFLFLRRYESFSVKYLLEGVRLGDVAWPFNVPRSSKQETEFQMKALSELFLWIYNELVIPIIKVRFFLNQDQLLCHRHCIVWE